MHPPTHMQVYLFVPVFTNVITSNKYLNNYSTKYRDTFQKKINLKFLKNKISEESIDNIL